MGKGYVYAATGQIITIDHLKEFDAQYGATMGDGYYEKGGDYTKGRCARWIGKEAYDCSGLGKCARKALDGVWKDVSAQGTYDQCTRRGGIKSMPRIPGTAVFMYTPAKRRMGHVGYYIGDGKVVEARGVAYGVVITRLEDRAWTHWGMMDHVDHDIPDEDKPVIVGPQADAGDGTNSKRDDDGRIKEIIRQAISDKIITAEGVWTEVLNGERVPPADWIAQVFANAHAAIEAARNG